MDVNRRFYKLGGRQLNMNEFFYLFPQPLMKVKVKEHNEFKKNVLPELIEQFTKDPNIKAPWGRFCNSWQIQVDVPKLNLEEYVDSWLEKFKYPKIKYKIEAWINVHTWDMFQDLHTHFGSNAILSGIYYLQLSSKDNPVVFERPFDYHLVYLNNLLEGGMPNDPIFRKYSTDIPLDIKEGDLIMFTPEQQHFVTQSKEKHDGHRISVAFNVVITK